MVTRLAGLVVVLAVMTSGEMTSAWTSPRTESHFYSPSPSTRSQRPVISGFSSVTPDPGPTQEGGDWIPNSNSTVILSSPVQEGIRGGQVTVGDSVFESVFSTKERDGFSQMATGKSVSLSTKRAERENTTTKPVTQPFAFQFSFRESHSTQYPVEFRHEPYASTATLPTNISKHEPFNSTDSSPTTAFRHEPFSSTDSSLTNAFTHEPFGSTESSPTTAFRHEPSVPTRSSPIQAPTPEHRNLSTESLMDCLLSGGILSMHAFSGSVTIDTSHLKPRNVSYVSSRCIVIITVPDGHIVALKPVRLQGLCNEILLYVVNRRVATSGKVIYEHVFLGCSRHFSSGWTPGREYIYLPPGSIPAVFVRHDRHSMSPSPIPSFSAEIHFSSLPGSTDLLNVDFTTPLNGKL